MEILKIIFIILEVVLLFNIIIIVHELGHFLAARWRGLKIDRFGVWFGKPLWQKEINGVTYCLGSIPAGGYVALPQMAPMEAIEGKNESSEEKLPPISALDKIIVAFAGPLFSFALAILFAVLVWNIGRPVRESETTTVIGYVNKGGPADEAGLKPGDNILSIEGEKVSRFQGIGDTVTWQIVSSVKDTLSIQVERDGAVKTVEVKPVVPESGSLQRRNLPQIQVQPKTTPLIARVHKNSPADAAGLEPNDFITAVDRTPLYHPLQLNDYIEEHGTEPMDLTVQRGEKIFQVKLTPEKPISPPDFERPLIGIAWDLTGKLDLAHPGPVEQVSDSVNAMVSTFQALFASKSEIGPQHLSGPVGIMRIYYILFESEQGWRLALWFSVILNVNLALLNMVPFPILDGGHILMAIVEWIRRKPIGLRIQQIIQTACAIVLIGFMLYLTLFDVVELPWNGNGGQEQDAPLKFAPKSETTSQ